MDWVRMRCAARWRGWGWRGAAGRLVLDRGRVEGGMISVHSSEPCRAADASSRAAKRQRAVPRLTSGTVDRPTIIFTWWVVNRVPGQPGLAPKRVRP